MSDSLKDRLIKALIVQNNPAFAPIIQALRETTREIVDDYQLSEFLTHLIKKHPSIWPNEAKSIFQDEKEKSKMAFVQFCKDITFEYSLTDAGVKPTPGKRGSF